MDRPASSVATSVVGDIAVVVVEGDADLFVTPSLEEQLMTQWKNGSPRVVVDLSAAAVVDSTILGVLLTTLKRVRARGGELVVVSPDAEIRRVFEITGLDRKVPLVASLEDALARAPLPAA